MVPALRLIALAVAGTMVVGKDVEVFTRSIPCNRRTDQRRLMNYTMNPSQCFVQIKRERRCFYEQYVLQLEPSDAFSRRSRISNEPHRSACKIHREQLE